MINIGNIKELIQNQIEIDGLKSYLGELELDLKPFPFPGPECTSCPPFDLSNQSFLPDSFLSSGDPNPQLNTNYFDVEPEPELSFNNFDDVGQNVQLVGDASLVDSFDIFG